MDFKRFGRLNTKKLTKIMNKGPLYEMAHCFPYLPTRSQKMKKRNKIECFKRMCQNYRYCYYLKSECIAKISVHSFERDKIEECREIDNNVYVFCDIPPIDFLNGDEDYEFDLLFDVKDRILITTTNGSGFNEDTILVLKEMRLRNADPIQLKILEEYLSTIDLISVESEYPADCETLDVAIFNEFKWRMILFGKFIYEMSDKELAKEKNEKYEYIEIKRKRSRVEDRYSLLRGININAIKYATKFYEDLKEIVSHSHSKSASKYLYDYLEERYAAEIYDKGFNVKAEEIFKDVFEISMNEKEHLQRVKDNYKFLLNPYSKDYRAFFKEKRKRLSLFKTQQVMRKLKNEYKSVDSRLNEIDSYQYVFEIIDKAIKDYTQDLGDNQLPNEGYGYEGDGWFDNEPEDSVVNDIRTETQWELEQEKNQRDELKFEKQIERDEIIDRIMRDNSIDWEEKDEIIESLYSEWELEDKAEFEHNIKQSLLNNYQPTYENEYCQYTDEEKEIFEADRRFEKQRQEEQKRLQERQEQIEFFIANRDKKGLFDFLKFRRKETEYFNYFESIAIKDVIDTEPSNIKNGVTLDGVFRSNNEIAKWKADNYIEEDIPF